jgi:alcohol dehydrogenase (cytochrome c)
MRLPSRNDQELAALIREGLPPRGMPPSSVTDDEMRGLVAYLRTLRPPQRRGSMAPVPAQVRTTDGQTLEGLILHQSFQDLQLQTHDRRVHLLRKAGDRYRPVTSQVDWPTYNGHWSGNRYSPLEQINRHNIARLAPVWIFSVPRSQHLQTTPVVIDGLMYITSANECFALDAGSGRQIWHFQRPRTQGLVGNAAGGVNRGVAVAGDRLFLVTDHAHLLALNRWTGELLWETEMADWRQNYNATSAPLVVGDLVVSGTAGGEQGVRGFLAAYDQATGNEVWRFWTVPKPGEPGADTWIGSDIEHGGAPTWLTGSYDPELEIVYWTTGNASPNLNGDQRLGDNLYACSVLALEAKTGQLLWYYQFTPHDEWDWDAQQPAVLVDTIWEGQPRQLLLHANRNGFFYVLDRTDGQLLLAQPFVKKLTWAREIGADGRPVENPDQRPTPEGARICPSLNGATNWFSTAFSPATGLYYVQTLEQCAIFTKRPVEWAAGQSFWGGATRPSPDDIPQKILRAIDIKTGQPAWELPQTGPGNSWGGALATASGLVFFGDDSGALMAVDAASGNPLWHFLANQRWTASPMTYLFDGKQYIAVAAGGNILSFALAE